MPDSVKKLCYKNNLVGIQQIPLLNLVFIYKTKLSTLESCGRKH